MSVDVRRILITEGIKLELVHDHAREMNNLQELYVFENGKVTRLEEQVKDLRREIVKQQIEFDEELINTIEGLEEEKYMWKKKYEEVLKLTEILIAEFDKREKHHPTDATTESPAHLSATGETAESSEKQHATDATTESYADRCQTGETAEAIEKHHPTDATTESHAYRCQTGETAESTENHNPTGGSIESQAFLCRTGETAESSEKHYPTDSTTELQAYICATGETAESTEQHNPTGGSIESQAFLCATTGETAGSTEEHHPTDGRIESNADLCPTDETAESFPRHSATGDVRSGPITRILRRLFVCGGKNVQHNE